MTAPKTKRFNKGGALQDQMSRIANMGDKKIKTSASTTDNVATVLNTTELDKINRRSRNLRLNATLSPDLFRSVIDRHGTHVLIAAMPHGDDMRTRWFIKVIGTMEPEEVVLDMTMADFLSLRSSIVPGNGEAK